MTVQMSSWSRDRTIPAFRAIIAVVSFATITHITVGMRLPIARLSRGGVNSIGWQRVVASSSRLAPSHGKFATSYEHRLDYAYFRSKFQLFSNQAETVSPTMVEEGEVGAEDSDDDDELCGSISSEESNDADDFRNLPNGSNEGFFVVQTFKTSESGFDMDELKAVISDDDVRRLELRPENVSVPVALMTLDPEEYPSMSRARKACRKGHIMVHRGPLSKDNATGKDVFDRKKCLKARVGDRIFPGDVVAKQIRMGDGYAPVMHHEKPPFDLPVLFEDDHMAIVNKPAGVVVYAHRAGGHGIMTVRAALPFAVTPPKAGTYSILRRPQPVHRLDKPTSGVLITAKTKPAMVNLSQQFRDRKVKKSYVAICNGIPPEFPERAISSKEAFEMGVDVDPNSDRSWQLITGALDEKSAVTVWRGLKYAKSLKANENYLTLVELKPKTGRYHQLRRHMAWVCRRPIVGDTIYDGGGSAMLLRQRGLFLCSNHVTLEHPFYNTDKGREAFNNLPESERAEMESIWVAPDGKIMLSVGIDIPEKFESFMARENDRYERLSTEEP